MTASHRKAATMSDDRVETVALALCHSGKFACDGRCAPICFEFMGNKPKRCGHAARVHGDLAHTVLRTLDPLIESLQAEVERLRKLLVEEREENLWNAFNSGHVKEGEWTHMFMSDGEWLARECGLDPRDGYYPEAEVRAKIPQAARQALAAKEQTR